MNFLQVNERSLLDRDEWQIIPMGRRGQQFDIDVPFFFWKFEERDVHRLPTTMQVVNGKLENVYSTFNNVQNIKLNDLSIDFYNSTYGVVRVTYFDKKLDKRVVMEINCIPFHEVSNVRGKMAMVVTGMDYQIGMTDRGRLQLHTKFDGVDQAFVKLSPLATQRGASYGKNVMSYGMSHVKLPLQYRGQELNHKYYAFICGVFCIMLDDEMKFDSLALLSGMRKGVLYVDKFVHTASPYVAKIITLWK